MEAICILCKKPNEKGRGEKWQCNCPQCKHGIVTGCMECDVEALNRTGGGMSDCPNCEALRERCRELTEFFDTNQSDTEKIQAQEKRIAVLEMERKGDEARITELTGRIAELELLDEKGLKAKDETIRQLRTALENLVTQLNIVHADKRYESVWCIAQFHNGPYAGPTYEKQLKEAEDALSPKTSNSNGNL